MQSITTNTSTIIPPLDTDIRVSRSATCFSHKSDPSSLANAHPFGNRREDPQEIAYANYGRHPIWKRNSTNNQIVYNDAGKRFNLRTFPERIMTTSRTPVNVHSTGRSRRKGHFEARSRNRLYNKNSESTANWEASMADTGTHRQNTNGCYPVFASTRLQ